MYNFVEVPYDSVDKTDYYSFRNKSIFTTFPWINYLLEDNPGSKPIVIKIMKKQMRIGYFTAIKIKKMGVPIIGSPFRGWGTSFMGLDIDDYTDIVEIYKELIAFLFKEHLVLYISISERHLNVDEAKKHFRTIPADSLELNIDRTDDGLFKVFKTDCRNFIRQFERRGATLEFAEPNDKFAEEFYLQAVDVFDKQGLVPTWTENKVKCLLKNLKTEDMVLCLRVRDPEGNSIATSIYPGFNNKFFFWAGASYRTGQHYRPNEYMIWTAIKYWRDRGVKYFDMVGVRDYKKKFGPEPIQYATMEFSKSDSIIWAKNEAEKLFYKSLEWRHKFNI